MMRNNYMVMKANMMIMTITTMLCFGVLITPAKFCCPRPRARNCRETSAFGLRVCRNFPPRSQCIQSDLWTQNLATASIELMHSRLQQRSFSQKMESWHFETKDHFQYAESSTAVTANPGGPLWPAPPQLIRCQAPPFASANVPLQHDCMIEWMQPFGIRVKWINLLTG